MIVFCLFVASTLITQIMVLNLLIAILSETHDKVNENYKSADQRQKLKVMAEYVGQVRVIDTYMCCCFKKVLKEKKEDKYLFMMKPFSADGEVDKSSSSSSSKGSKSNVTSFLKSFMDSKFRELDNNINKKILGAIYDSD